MRNLLIKTDIVEWFTGGVILLMLGMMAAHWHLCNKIADGYSDYRYGSIAYDNIVQWVEDEYPR